MQTFEATLRSGWFWAAAFVPPVLFLLVVQFWGNASDQHTFPIPRVLLLLGLSQAMPLAALAWMLCSKAAYSVGAGKLIVHRVIGDREYPLSQLTGPPQLERGVVTVPTRGKRLRLRVGVPQACFEALQRAAIQS